MSGWVRSRAKARAGFPPQDTFLGVAVVGVEQSQPGATSIVRHPANKTPVFQLLASWGMCSYSVDDRGSS